MPPRKLFDTAAAFQTPYERGVGAAGKVGSPDQRTGPVRQDQSKPVARSKTANSAAECDRRLDDAAAAFRRGEYEQAWRDYEHRYRRNPGDDLRAVTCARTGRKIPHWTQGDPPSRLLVVAEQGLGDSINFVRYAADLCERGVEVTLADWPALDRLFASAHPDLKFTARHEAVTVENGEAFVRLMSLPLRMRSFEPTAREAYLRAPSPSPEITRDVEAVLDRDRLNVGLVWRGNRDHRNDARRSMSLGALKPLFDTPGLNLINLQHEEAPAFSDPGLLSGLRRPSRRVFGENRVFDGVAALASRLDLVVSVDTAVAHLSGALGTPTILMLHAPDPDWRWPGDADAPAWYTSVSRVVQPRPGDWRGAVEAILPRIEAMARARSGGAGGAA